MHLRVCFFLLLFFFSFFFQAWLKRTMGAAPGQFLCRGFLKVVAIGAVVLLVLTAVLYGDSTLQLHR